MTCWTWSINAAITANSHQSSHLVKCQLCSGPDCMVLGPIMGPTKCMAQSFNMFITCSSFSATLSRSAKQSVSWVVVGSSPIDQPGDYNILQQQSAEMFDLVWPLLFSTYSSSASWKTAKGIQNCSVKISPAAVPAYLGVLVIEDLVMAFFARCHLLHRALVCLVQHWKQTAWIGFVMLVMQRLSHSKKTENEAAPNSRSRWKTEPGEKSPCHSPPLVASNIGLRQDARLFFKVKRP